MMRQLIKTSAFCVCLLGMAANIQAQNPQDLYTQTGSDPSFRQLINSGELPTGSNSTRGVRGSTIDVNNRLVEVGVNARRPIPQAIKIHTLGNSVIPRRDFDRWSRWYQEDGNTQVFRLFRGEENVRNDRAAAARIESFSDVRWGRGAWHEWVGTYTIIKPISCAIFQAKDQENDWSVQLNMTDEGHVILNRRRGNDEILERNMVGKPFEVRIRDNGHDYEVYYKGRFAGGGTWARPNGRTNFRWGCYMGKDIPQRDAMLFVTGATVDPRNNPPPVPTRTPVPSPPPSSDDLSCLAAGRSETAAQSTFSRQCASFTRRDCDAMRGVGQGWWVCSSQQMDGGEIATVQGNALTIQAEDYQSARDTSAGNRNGLYRNGNVDIIALSDSGSNFGVGYTANNEYLTYDFLNLREGNYQLQLRVSSAQDTGMVSVEVDGDSRIGSRAVNYTGGWDNYRTMTLDIGRLDVGSHSIKINIKNAPFNLNWLRLVHDGGASPTATPQPTSTPRPTPTATPPPTTGNCVAYRAGARQEFSLPGGGCIDFPTNLNSKTIQVWDSDQNSSCNFRGSLESVNGSGSVNVNANYVQASNLSGTRLRVRSSNGCAFLKVRVF